MTLEDTIRAAVEAAVRQAVAPLEEQVRQLHGEHQPPGEYLSAERAARMIEVTPDTIRQWVRDGLLTRYSAGRGLRGMRVRRDELVRFLERGGPAPRKAPTDAELRERALAIVGGRSRG